MATSHFQSRIKGVGLSRNGGGVTAPVHRCNVMNHTQGTGLNLALASAIVTTYGGALHAYSAGVGQGATFTVELPEVSLV